MDLRQKFKEMSWSEVIGYSGLVSFFSFAFGWNVLHRIESNKKFEEMVVAQTLVNPDESISRYSVTSTDSFRIDSWDENYPHAGPKTLQECFELAHDVLKHDVDLATARVKCYDGDDNLRLDISSVNYARFKSPRNISSFSEMDADAELVNSYFWLHYR